jgi:hypothetical protein
MKKRFLLIAIAGAIVVGCASEALDTSYEQVKQEALANGQHPLVFNAYVGNGMGTTRAILGNTNTLISEIGHADNYFPGNSAASRAFGVFAYYYDYNSSSGTGIDGYFKTYLASGEEDGMYEGSNKYTSSTPFSPLAIKSLTPDFMYNTKIYYEGSSTQHIMVLDDATATYTQQRAMYWPMNMTNKKMSFFAYYPHVNTYDAAYVGSENPLRIIAKGQSGAPILNYQVGGYATEDNLDQYDLMAATPVLDVNSGTINLAFKHLLTAVSVKIQYTSSGASSGDPSPEFNFYRAGLFGASDYDSSTGLGKVTEDTQFKKQGLFNLATGKWFTRGYADFNLLGNTWLLQADDIQFGNDYSYPLFSSQNQSSYGSSTSWYVDGVNEYNSSSSDLENDKYLLLIPNSNQDALNVRLGFYIDYGGYKENVDIEKYINTGNFKPGYIYQVLLTLDLKTMTIECTVDDWTMGSQITNP